MKQMSRRSLLLTALTFHADYYYSRLPSLEALPQDIPSVPPGSDIRPQLLQTGDGASRPRPRGTGKLLSSTQGVGLALVRLEQVEAVEQGKAKFSLSGPTEGEELGVTPYWPDWWPQQPSDSGLD